MTEKLRLSQLTRSIFWHRANYQGVEIIVIRTGFTKRWACAKARADLQQMVTG